jgi:hypothetical protein
VEEEVPAPEQLLGQELGQAAPAHVGGVGGAEPHQIEDVAVQHEHRGRAREVQLGQLAGPRREVGGQGAGPRLTPSEPARVLSAGRGRGGRGGSSGGGGGGLTRTSVTSVVRIDGASSRSDRPVMACSSRMVSSVCDMPAATASTWIDSSSGFWWLIAISVSAWIFDSMRSSSMVTNSALFLALL